MTNYISLILVIVLLFTLCSCSNTTAAPETVTSTATTSSSAESIPATNPQPPESLKILAIGNSFSQDATWQLYTIMKAEGVKEIVIGNMFVGSCTLEKHANFAQNNDAAYRYYKNTKGTWETSEGTTLEKAIRDEQWDVIVMQQGSAVSGVPSSYSPHLENLIAYVKDNMTNPDCKLYWHMTWAYQADSTHASFPKYGNNQLTMYDCISKSVQTAVAPNNAFAGLLPVGTVIQNARTGFVGDTLTRDGHHLSNFGRVLASYTWYAVFTGQPLATVNVASFDCGVSLTQAHRDLIVSAVNDAIAQPYSVTEQ